MLGIALIALREEIGRDMVIRSFDHLLQYGEVNIRRAVPLALGILSVCDPDISVMDTLSKFSHDHDAEVRNTDSTWRFEFSHLFDRSLWVPSLLWASSVLEQTILELQPC